MNATICKRGINPRTGKRAIVDMVYEHLKNNAGKSFSAAELSKVLETKYATSMDSNRLYFVLLRLLKDARGAYPHIFRVGHGEYQYNTTLKRKNGSARLNGSQKAQLIFGKTLDEIRAARSSKKAAPKKSVATKVTPAKTSTTTFANGMVVDADAVVLRDRSGAYYIARKVK